MHQLLKIGYIGGLGWDGDTTRFVEVAYLCFEEYGISHRISASGSCIVYNKMKIGREPVDEPTEKLLPEVIGSKLFRCHRLTFHQMADG